MVWSTFAVSGDVGFRYITEPTNWPKFWLDLMDIPDRDRAGWRDPGDSVRLRMRLAGPIADLHMNLVSCALRRSLARRVLQEGRPEASSPRVT